MTDEHIIEWARKKFERTAKRIDIGVPFGDKAEDALWFVAPRLFAAVDERDALRSQIKEWMIANGPGGWIDAERKRVAELEQKLQDSATEARYLNDWRKWQERNR